MLNNKIHTRIKKDESVLIYIQYCTDFRGDEKLENLGGPMIIEGHLRKNVLFTSDLKNWGS